MRFNRKRENRYFSKNGAIMKYGIVTGAIAAFILCTCAPDKPSPLFLTIIHPRDNDVVTTLTNPVEGKTYPGSIATVGFEQNNPASTLIPDDTGRFVGTYTIPTDNPGMYSVYITVSYQSTHITETRTVTYQRP
jgi:hypothetical protein